MGFREKWNEAKVRNAEYAELQAERNLADTRWNWTRTDSFRKLLIGLSFVWPVVIMWVHFKADSTRLQSGWDLIPWTLITLFVGIAILFFLRVSVRTIGDLPDEYLDERMLRIRNEGYVWAYRVLAEIIAILVTIPLIWMMWTSQNPDSMAVTFSDYDLLGLLFGVFAICLYLPSVALLVKNFRI